MEMIRQKTSHHSPGGLRKFRRIQRVEGFLGFGFKPLGGTPPPAAGACLIFFQREKSWDTKQSIKKIPFLEAGNTEFQTIIFRLHVGLSVCNLICFFFGNIGYRAVFFWSPTEPFFCLAMFICKYSAWVRSAQSLRKQNPVNSMVAKDLKSYLVL